MECHILHTKLRAVRLQSWPHAFFLFQIFAFQIFLFQIFVLKIDSQINTGFSPTCCLLANFHQAFPQNMIITQRIAWQVSGFCIKDICIENICIKQISVFQIMIITEQTACQVLGSDISKYGRGGNWNNS